MILSPASDCLWIPRSNGLPIPITNPLSIAQRVLEFMRLATDGDACYFTATTDSNGRRIVNVSVLGKLLPDIFRYELGFRDYVEYHPYVTCFYEVLRNHEIRRCEVFARDLRANFSPALLMLFDDFVMALRKAVSEEGAKKKVAGWEVRYHGNYDRLCRIANAVLACNDRVRPLVLCLSHISASVNSIVEACEIDKCLDERNGLAYRNYDLGRDFHDVLDCESKVSHERAQEDRNHLLANMKGKRSLFGSLEGYAWRQAWAPHVGFYLLITFLMDADRMPNDVDLPLAIGKYWSSDITQGNGVSWDVTEKVGFVANGSQEPRLLAHHLNRWLRGRNPFLDAFGWPVPPYQILPGKKQHMFDGGLAGKSKAAVRRLPRTASQAS